ncbi:MAG: hypothetical protein ACRYFV_25170 [Janthinobacterium lividum]
MKTTLLLSALLGVVTLSHAQTAPSTSTGTAAPVTGTKNVGGDRADAPQAPGMQSTTPTTTSSRKSANKSAGSRKVPNSAGMDKPTSTPK